MKDIFALKMLDSEETIKDFLNVALESYIEDGDFNAFYSELEIVIKARENVSGFCRKLNINRSNLYAMFKNKTNPRLDTIAKILHELGFTLRVA
jgi:probable addiction module antidote protein